MSFSAAEKSIAAARHARLYQIERSETVVWRYTSADRAITWDGHTWEPLAISDDGVRMTGEASADALKITLPATAPAAQLFRSTPPSVEVFVTLYDYDAGENDALVAWVGSISAVIFTQPGAAQLSCASLSASMQREGLRLKYEMACPHSVYDRMCGVIKALYAMPVTVTALDAVSVTVVRASDGANLPDVGYYLYGAAEWAQDGATETRGIEATSGTGTLTLLGGTDGLGASDSLTIYPGCDGTRAMCQNRFNNLLNHGGFPHMPGESIYGKRIW